MILELLDSAVEEKIKFSSYAIYHAAEIELANISSIELEVQKSQKDIRTTREKFQTLLDRLPLSEFELMNYICEFHENLYGITKLAAQVKYLASIGDSRFYDVQTALGIYEQDSFKMKRETDGFPEQCYCSVKCSFYKEAIGKYSNHIELLLQNFFNEYYEENDDIGFIRHSY